MSEEKSVELKKTVRKKRSSTPQNERYCIIHLKQNKTDTEIRPLTEHSFSKIKEVADIRKSSGNQDDNFKEIIFQLPECFNPTIHGSHRWCYKNFTNVSRLKRKNSDTCIDNEGGSSKRRRRSNESPSTSAILLPSNKCLFCNKQDLKVKGERQVLVKCVTKTASIKLAAEQEKDEALLCQIHDIDLVAREAHYHNHCRRAYTRNQVRHSGSADSETLAVLEAHRKAFELLCYYIQENIIAGMKVERMTMLRERYLLYLMEVDADAYNENYKTDKLKDKMKNRFWTKIQFWRPSSESELVYSDEILKGQAVEVAFESACSDEKRIEEAALILRRHVLDAKTAREISLFRQLLLGFYQTRENHQIFWKIFCHIL